MSRNNPYKCGWNCGFTTRFSDVCNKHDRFECVENPHGSEASSSASSTWSQRQQQKDEEARKRREQEKCKDMLRKEENRVREDADHRKRDTNAYAQRTRKDEQQQQQQRAHKAASRDKRDTEFYLNYRRREEEEENRLRGGVRRIKNNKL